MNKIIVLLNIFLFLNCLTIVGQTDNDFLEIPQKFILPLENVDYKIDNAILKGSAWQVYSDRQYNKTYNSPKGGDVKFIIDFLSPFFVYDRKGNYLNIYKVTINIDNNSNDVIDYGWIHMDNLLLWNHSLVTNNNIKLKAIVVRTEKNDNFLNTHLSDSTSDFGLFYVYKIQKNTVLLGKKPRFIDTEVGVENCLTSWVPKENIWLWKDVLTIEPVFCELHENSGNCIPENIRVYSDKKSAKKFAVNPVFDKNQIYGLNRINNNWSGDQIRFPVLSIKDNIAEIVLFDKLHLSNSDLSKNVTFGFTPIENITVGSRLFTKTYLFSSEELAKTNTVLDELSQIDHYSSVRKQVYDLWINILKKEYYGETETILKTITMGEIHNYFFRKQLKEYISPEMELDQLLDTLLISDKNIELYSDEIIKSYKGFRSILNGNSNSFHFTSNGILYYWIDSNLLP